jgi:hypothetical protein
MLLTGTTRESIDSFETTNEPSAGFSSKRSRQESEFAAAQQDEHPSEDALIGNKIFTFFVDEQQVPTEAVCNEGTGSCHGFAKVQESLPHPLFYYYLSAVPLFVKDPKDVNA